MGTEIEEIKSRLNIIDVLGEYIRLEKAGINFKAVCPFHNEKTPSFMVSEERQMWHCFGCQKGGDVFSFVMEMEGVEFKEALRILAEKAGIEIKTYNYQKNKERNRTLEILEEATIFWEKRLWENTEGKIALNYLKNRGLRNETIKKFRLGYAPNGWKNILDFLIENGYKKFSSTNYLIQSFIQQHKSFKIRIKEGNNIPDFICTMLYPTIRSNRFIIIPTFKQCSRMPTPFVPHYKKKRIIVMPVQAVLGKSTKIITITHSTIECFNRCLPVITNVFCVFYICNKPGRNPERHV